MGSLKKKLSRAFFKLKGWELIGELPSTKKYVVILAPHTSIKDMIYGKLYNWAFEMKPQIMVKKEFFFFPVGNIIRMWGAIPINRKYPGGIVKQMADNFKKLDELVLAITPEGTRSPNPNWKSGFYRIAEAANVPLYLSVIDFKTKQIGYIGEHKITGDFKKDIKDIKDKYKNVEGYHKDKFVL